MSFATMSKKHSNKVSLLQFEEKFDHGDAAVGQVAGVRSWSQALGDAVGLDCPRSGPGPVWALFADPGPGPRVQVQR